jgi:hypothetical protein
VNRPLGTMAAVALGYNAVAPIRYIHFLVCAAEYVLETLPFRLYLQDEKDDLVEWCGNSSSTDWHLYAASLFLFVKR